jgi:hypothetical protein
MLRLSVTYDSAAELRRALEEELARGVLLVKVTPPADLEFRAPVWLQVASIGGTIGLDSEVVSILPGVGVVVAFPAPRLSDAWALLACTPEELGGGPTVHEILTDAPAAPKPARDEAGKPAAERMSSADKIRLALYGSREDRAMILRDPTRALHQYVLKSPQVTIDEVTAWVKNPQMSVDFLKQIADRKEWLARPAIAQGLARNPKAPLDLALRALDHVGAEALRQMAKGTGVSPNIAAAARKRLLRK